MNLTSEQVHWIFGALVTAAATFLILRDYGRLATGWLDYVMPTLLLLFGIELLLDPLVHGTAVPRDYAAETAQHFALGLFLIGSAASEMVRVRRKAEGRAWRSPFAATLMIAAGVFAFHSQHDSTAPMMLLMVQHRVIAATLAMGSLTFLLASTRIHRIAPSAFSTLILLLGFELLLYTEGNTIFGEHMSGHMMGPA